MKLIPDIMKEINEVMALVDEDQLDAAMPLLTKDKRILLSVPVAPASKQRVLPCA